MTTWQRLQQANLPFLHGQEPTIECQTGFDALQAQCETEIAIANEISSGKKKMDNSQRTEAYTALVKASAYKLAVELVRADYIELAKLRKEKQVDGNLLSSIR